MGAGPLHGVDKEILLLIKSEVGLVLALHRRYVELLPVNTVGGNGKTRVQQCGFVAPLRVGIPAIVDDHGYPPRAKVGLLPQGPV